MRGSDVTVPAAVREGPFWWDSPEIALRLIDLQARADEDGFVHDFSTRLASEWWRCSRRQVAATLDRLEDAGLIQYPDGQPERRYRLKLLDPWPKAGHQMRTTPKPSAAAELDTATIEKRATESGPPQNPSPTSGYSAGSGKADHPNRATENPRKMERAKRAESFVKGSVETSRMGHTSKGAPPPYGPPSSNGGSGEKAAEQAEAFPEFPTDEERAKKAVHRLMRLLAEHGFKGIGLTGKVYQKQAAILRRLAVDQGEEQTAKAIIGVALMDWFADGGRPYDAFQVEKHFGKAVAAYEQNRKQRGGGIDERVARQEERKAEQARREEQYRRDLEEWRSKAIELIRAAAPEDVRALKRQANEKFMPLPGDIEKKKYWAREWVLSEYAGRNGLPRPAPP